MARVRYPFFLPFNCPHASFSGGFTADQIHAMYWRVRTWQIKLSITGLQRMETKYNGTLEVRDGSYGTLYFSGSRRNQSPDYAHPNATDEVTVETDLVAYPQIKRYAGGDVGVDAVNVPATGSIQSSVGYSGATKLIFYDAQGNDAGGVHYNPTTQLYMPAVTANINLSVSGGAGNITTYTNLASARFDQIVAVQANLWLMGQNISQLSINVGFTASDQTIGSPTSVLPGSMRIDVAPYKWWTYDRLLLPGSPIYYESDGTRQINPATGATWTDLEIQFAPLP